MALEQFLLAHARVSGKNHRRITLDDKMTFFQQLSAMVSSGTPLLQSLHIAAEQNQSLRLRSILSDVAARVAAGCALNSAMADHRHVFDDHWIAVIATGEMSGKLGQVLCDLNEQIRTSRETRRRITGALIYPIILLVVAVLVIVVMLWFVVPTFGDMFEEMGAELPAVTQFVLHTSDLIVQYGGYGIVGLVILGFILRHYLRTDAGRRWLVAIGLATPLVGDLMVQSAMYRFASNLALLLKSGVPIMDTMSALGAVFHSNPAYRDALSYAQQRVAAGRTLAEALEESELFPTMMTNIVRIGEESAQLTSVMEQIAPYYLEKMNGFINRVTKLLEPSIIMVMGFTISVVMLAIYIPMFEMAGKVN